jgi:uncharacterized protein
MLVAFYPTFIFEAFSTMLLGMGLFKLGILQGDRTPRFYLTLALLAYIPGLAARALGCGQQADFQASPHIEMFTGPLSRVAVTLGHVAAINLLMKGRAGQALLAPFKAVGRTAFSLYLMQNFLGMWVLFSGFGLGLWGRFGWSGLATIALGVMAAQVVLANLWMRAFAVGPMEWAWRSLAYLKVLPFRNRPVELVEIGLPA